MKDNDEGYSLIETLIAFAIMALVLSALLPGQAKLLGRASILETELLAMDYAISMLDTVGISKPVSIGNSQIEYRDWAIQYLAEDAVGFNGANKYLSITIKVQNGQGVDLAVASKVVLKDEG